MNHKQSFSPHLLSFVSIETFYVCGYVIQELKTRAPDAQHRVDELSGLTQSMLNVVKDSPTKSTIRQKIHRLQSSLQNIDSELGQITSSHCMLCFTAMTVSACIMFLLLMITSPLLLHCFTLSVV